MHAHSYVGFLLCLQKIEYVSHISEEDFENFSSDQHLFTNFPMSHHCVRTQGNDEKMESDRRLWSRRSKKAVITTVTM